MLRFKRVSKREYPMKIDRQNSETDNLPKEMSEHDQIWAAIRQMKEEIDTQGKILKRVALEVSSLKSVKKSSDAGSSSALVAQTLRRSDQSVSVDVWSSPDESQSQTRARKGVHSRFQPDMKGLNSEMECLDMKNKEACQPTLRTSTGSGRISEPNASEGKMPLDVSNESTFNSQTHRNIPGNHQD